MLIKNILLMLIMIGLIIDIVWFNIKAHELLKKYVGGWDAFRIKMGGENSKDKIPAEEWARYERYRRKQIL